MNLAKIVRDAFVARNFDLIFETLNSIKFENNNFDLRDSILLLQSQYHHVRKEDKEGILSYEEKNLSYNKINMLVLHIANQLQNVPSQEHKNNSTVVLNKTQEGILDSFNEIRKYYEFNDYQIINYKKVNQYIVKILSLNILDDSWLSKFYEEFKNKINRLSQIDSYITRTNLIIDKSSPDWYKIDTNIRNHTKNLVLKIFNEMEYWQIDDYHNEIEKYYNKINSQLEKENDRVEGLGILFRGSIYTLLIATGILLYYFFGLKGLGFGVLGLFVLSALSFLIPAF